VILALDACRQCILLCIVMACLKNSSLLWVFVQLDNSDDSSVVGLVQSFGWDNNQLFKQEANKYPDTFVGANEAINWANAGSTVFSILLWSMVSYCLMALFLMRVIKTWKVHFKWIFVLLGLFNCAAIIYAFVQYYWTFYSYWNAGASNDYSTVEPVTPFPCSQCTSTNYNRTPIPDWGVILLCILLFNGMQVVRLFYNSIHEWAKWTSEMQKMRDKSQKNVKRLRKKLYFLLCTIANCKKCVDACFRFCTQLVWSVLFCSKSCIFDLRLVFVVCCFFNGEFILLCVCRNSLFCRRFGDLTCFHAIFYFVCKSVDFLCAVRSTATDGLFKLPLVPPVKVPSVVHHYFFKSNLNSCLTQCSSPISLLRGVL